MVQPLKDEKVDYTISHLANNPKTLLLNAIGESSSTIDTVIFNFEDLEIAEALFEARTKGVEVRVITDSEKAEHKKRAKLLNTFTHNQIDVKFITSKKMHLKMTMVDKNVVVMGSYNFTEESATENIEQLVSISNSELAKEWPN